MIYLNNENFDEEVIQSKGKILVDFYADWCGPCQGPVSYTHLTLPTTERV